MPLNGNMFGEKVDVNGVGIHYYKVGQGDVAVLLFSGALGNIKKDFAGQFEGMDLEQFTLIAWDPPGFGFSRPPERKFVGVQTYWNDADMGAGLMEALGYDSYSLMGWCNGSRAAMCLAIKYPSRVDKLVVWGGSSHYNAGEAAVFNGLEDVSLWKAKLKDPYLEVYDEKTFQALWSKHLSFIKTVGDICKDKLDEILCPTLVLHGDKDTILKMDHAKYLTENISDARLYRFPEGGHNIHMQFPDEFNREVTEFLLD